MLSFEFGGKDSFKDFGVYIETRPKIPSPKRKVSYLSISGRHGNLRYDEGVYEDITLTVECVLVGNIDDRIERIKSWLFSAGESDLIFSFQQEKRYIAQVVNQIDFEISLRQIGRFIIIFNCQPFKYAVDHVPLTITESNTTITNIGTLESEPIIEVYGNGDICLIINASKIYLSDINSKIILNSILQDAYDENLKNLNMKVSGEFLKIKVGLNQISWSGNVTKVIIHPNWRWL